MKKIVYFNMRPATTAFWHADFFQDTRKVGTLIIMPNLTPELQFEALNKEVHRHIDLGNKDDYFEIGTRPGWYYDRAELEALFAEVKKTPILPYMFKFPDMETPTENLPATTEQDPHLKMNAAKSILDASINDLPNKIKAYGFAMQEAAHKNALDHFKKMEDHPAREKETYLAKLHFAIGELEDMQNCMETPKERIAALKQLIEENKKVI